MVRWIAGWTASRRLSEGTRRAINAQPMDEPFVGAGPRTVGRFLFVSETIRGVSIMAKVLCVLYDDPVDGYPKSYPRDDLPKIEHYPGGQTLPTPKAIDFKPGALLGSVSGELGLRTYLESLGHTFIVTSDEEGPNSRFERELPDAEIVISQPFWPAYLTPERIAEAKNLKLAITAGIGSDHVDLH